MLLGENVDLGFRSAAKTTKVLDYVERRSEKLGETQMRYISTPLEVYEPERPNDAEEGAVLHSDRSRAMTTLRARSGRGPRPSDSVGPHRRQERAPPSVHWLEFLWWQNSAG